MTQQFPQIEDVPAPEQPGTASYTRTPWGRIFGALSLPVFFVIMFSLCYISAFHRPSPDHLPVVLVGAPAQTGPLLEQLRLGVGDTLDLTAVSTPEQALAQIRNRDVVGSIQLGQQITVSVASAAGAVTPRVVTGLAQRLAQQGGQRVVTTDVVPLPDQDPSGTGLFYFLIICTIGGYLTVTVLTQAAQGLRLTYTYAILGVAAVVFPLMEMGLASHFVGTFGAPSGAVVQMLLIGMVYTFAVGTIAILANQLLGPAAIFAIMTLVVFLNFPSSGGAIPAVMLPSFWQGLHSVWVGASAMEAIRSVIYFGGRGATTWLIQLTLWLLVPVILSLMLSLVRRSKSSTFSTAGNSAPLM